MVTVSDWLESSTNRLNSAGITSARLDSLILLEHILHATRETLLARGEFELSKDQITDLQALLERRVKLEPIAYLVGHKDFYGVDFIVDRNVLVPRPETEKLVEHIIDNSPMHSRVLDVGTGSGIIAISLKKNRNDLGVSASDVSKEALSVARKNASKHETFIGFIQSDLFKQIKPLKQFDIIAANLPYVSLDNISAHPELKHEPAIALFPDDRRGLSIYESFFRDVRRYISDNGYIIVEHDPSQLEEMLKLGKIAKYNGSSVSPFITKFSPIQTHKVNIN